MLLLQLVNRMVSYGEQQKWISEGQSIAYGKIAAEVLRKSKYAKDVMAEVDAMSDDAVDDGLLHLEPGEPGKGDR
ncbi:MAG TPA: hypothetical protein VE988_00260 [Gemmataceae bacterium]|nr:hypothetical protein [Gemmataceae bacterium]